MTGINWNQFRAKFNGQETKAFESLSYYLFCFELQQPYGIFRFKNQMGIETEPIAFQDRVIGFQSKFFDKKLSDSKADIIESIEKAKSKNPALTELYLYTNQEFSESSRKNVKQSRPQSDMEQRAAELGMKLVWRMPSHFEKQLIAPANLHIANYFFGNASSCIDYLGAITSHSDNILFAIRSNIKFGNSELHVDRTAILNRIKDKVRTPGITVISGDGGSGKTAIIKELYGHYRTKIPFYAFKAVEFNVHNINAYFRNYGKFSFEDFLNFHAEDDEKIIVVDSAESLSELENREAFKEFLAGLLRHSWRIIFTTRDSYLDDLRYQLREIYSVPFESEFAENLTTEELNTLSETHGFDLPDNPQLLALIKNLFYLDEYLQNYSDLAGRTTYSSFKEILWNKKIQDSQFRLKNTHLLRESCFLAIARQRCSTGRFFVNPLHCSTEILALLERDEIIKFDVANNGYFITHDIYEEWGLEVLIDREFRSQATYDGFLSAIGSNLPVRRAFRKWLSNRLYDSIDDVEKFISYTITSKTTASHWKDETLVAVLLSEHSGIFFERFKSLLFENEHALLDRVIFLLRIACKELDEFKNNLYGEANLKHIFTKPKGSGWQVVIRILHEKVTDLPARVIQLILAVLQEWVKTNPTGETTRHSGLTALKLYQKLEQDDVFRYLDIEKSLVEILLAATIEISQELKILVAEILSHDASKRDAPYFELIETILSASHENFIFIKTLPDEVMLLAQKFWDRSSDAQENDFYSHSTGTEDYYGLSKVWHRKYNPASAYQTPTYRLLENDFIKTLKFIVGFTNHAIAHYRKSKVGTNLHEITLALPDGISKTQYISSDLWDMYRGSGHSPEVLQSMHMALEKFMLELVPIDKDNLLEKWLFYILEKSESASLTAVVASLVLAHPDRFFNVACVLFTSPEILMCSRFCSRNEFQVTSLNNFGRGINANDKFYEDERDLSNALPHRDMALETLMINYQLFRFSDTPEEVAEDRRKRIHVIINELYRRFPEKKDASDGYMTYRLLIAQLDSRTMAPVAEQSGDKVLIHLNPEIAQDLKDHSEQALESTKDWARYIQLNLWAQHKSDKRNPAANYEKYNSNPRLALSEAKELVQILESGKDDDLLPLDDRIPAYVCAALINEFPSHLDDSDLIFCKDTLLRYAALHMHPEYGYQIADGVEVSLNTLPRLLTFFPELKYEIRRILLCTLLDHTPIGEYKRVCDYAVETLQKDLADSNSLSYPDFIWGYLRLKPLYDSLETTAPRFHHQRGDTLGKFTKKFSSAIQLFTEGPVAVESLTASHSLTDLLLVFSMIPVQTDSAQLVELARQIVDQSLPQLLVHDRNNQIKYSLRSKFFRHISSFLLRRNDGLVDGFLTSLSENLVGSNESVQLLQEIILLEDVLLTYDPFWKIWDALYGRIKLICNVGAGHYTGELAKTYLLAGQYWKSSATDWPTLKDRERLFFEKVSEDIGQYPYVLFAYAKLLNGIGSGFIEFGIGWLATVIEKQPGNDRRQDEYTVFYLENVVRKYIFLNRDRVRKHVQLKGRVLVILDYLIQKTSVSAYLLREDIL